MDTTQHHQITSKKGFTLIEVIVAIVVISVALFTLAGLSTAVIKSGYTGKKLTASSVLAQEKLEYYKRIGYDAFGPGTLPPEDYGTIHDSTGSTSTYSGYRREIVITDGPAANMRTVTVSIRSRHDGSTATFRTIVQR